jgi:TPR repeat protein
MMNTMKRHPWRMWLAAPAWLASFVQPALAQSSQPAPATAAHDTVVVSGTRSAGAAHLVDPATSTILNGRSASSCAFIGPYNPAFDPVTVGYLQDFTAPDSISRDVVAVSEYAPAGDVSNLRIPSIFDGWRGRGRGFGGRAGLYGLSGNCSQADLRFAAGRAHIARNDKSLAQAFEAFSHKDYPTAQALFRTAYDKIGYHAAALMLGQMHLYGLGTPKDSRQAIYWFDRVAGDRFDPAQRMRFDPANPQMMSERAQAAVMLARIYQQGLGVPADPGRARHWYEKAADFGYVPALDMLGRGWAAGSFGSKNDDKALAYLKDAAQAGYAPAQYRLGKLYFNGAGGAAPDTRLAGAYFEAAARAGHPAALFAAGRMVDMGVGVPADPHKALVYYKEAALKGDRDAEFALGTYFYEGGVVAKDVKTARGWFDAAARQGQPDAMYSLGAMLSKGEGGPPDLAMAYVWLSLAGSAGHDDAPAALRMIGPRLSAQDRARADAVLKPAPKS